MFFHQMLKDKNRIRPSGYFSENKLQEGSVVLLFPDIGNPPSNIDNIYNSLQLVSIEGRRHMFVITKLDKANKTFVGHLITSQYYNMDESIKKLYFKLPKGSAEGKDGKGNIFTLKKGSAVYLYSRTLELPFSSIYKICGNINSVVMKELKEAILEHSLHPLAKFSVYESKNKIFERGNTMISLRVIYKPEIDKVHCKKIEGKDPFDALLNLAKLYDVEVDEDMIEDQAFLDLIDLLVEDERVNLTFIQNAETGETYYDIAFQ